MDSQAQLHSTTVIDLVPIWEDDQGGGSFDAAGARAMVGAAVQAPERPARVAIAPERVDPATPEPTVSAFSYDLLRDDEETWAERHESDAADAVDYDALRRRDIARELLRARLINLAEQREHRSAYELAFLMLVAAVAVLLAAPPLVQIFLAMHGTQV